MIRVAFKHGLISCALMGILAAQGAQAGEESLVDKAGRGIKKGADATGRGLKKGAAATGRGLEKAGNWISKKVGKSGDK